MSDILSNGNIIANRANTARTEDTTVIPVQHVDAGGIVGGVTLNTALDKTIDSITAYPAGCNATTVDLATDADVTVTDSPAILLGYTVDTAMSAHDALIKNATTTVFTVPASSAAGFDRDTRSTSFATSIIVESNDAATGKIILFWIPAV